MVSIGLIALVAIPTRSAQGDVIRLQNGDVLRGEVLDGGAEKVHMKHVSGSDVRVAWGDVASIETDKAIELKLLDGSRIKGRLEPGATTGTADIVTEHAGRVAAVELADVAALNEPPEDVYWHGQISVGLTIQDGNTNTKTIFGSFDGTRKSKSDRIEANGYYAYGTLEEVLSTRKGFARVQYSYYVRAPLYLYVGAALEYDYFQDLRLRSRGGGGAGYAFFDEEALLLRTEAGIEYVNEDYRGARVDENFVALRLAGHFQWQLTKWLRVGERVEFFPSLEDFDDFFLRSITSANIEVVGGFGVGGQIIWEHDQIPSSGRGRNDTTYILTLTYAF